MERLEQEKKMKELENRLKQLEGSKESKESSFWNSLMDQVAMEYVFGRRAS